jgi:hypothetical protein
VSSLTPARAARERAKNEAGSGGIGYPYKTIGNALAIFCNAPHSSFQRPGRCPAPVRPIPLHMCAPHRRRPDPSGCRTSDSGHQPTQLLKCLAERRDAGLTFGVVRSSVQENADPRICTGDCARAAIGQAATAPPINAINVRRCLLHFITQPPEVKKHGDAPSSRSAAARRTAVACYGVIAARRYCAAFISNHSR